MKPMEGLHALLMDLFGSFIGVSTEKVDVVIVQALEKIGRFVDADRACIFLYATDHSECTNTHEWCYEGIQPHKGKLKHLPVPVIAPLHDAHVEGELYYVKEAALLPEAPLKTFLLNRQVQSMVAFPMMEQDTCLGFVSLDAVRRKRQLTDEETTLLAGFAQTMVKLMVQHRTDQELQETKERLAGVLDYSHDAILRIDQQDVITFANLAYCELVGSERSQVVGRSLWEFLNPEEQRRARAHLETLKKTGEVEVHTDWLQDANGENHWFEWTDYPVRDKPGTVVEYQSVGHDMTHRFVLEQHLLESEARYRSVIAASGTGAWEFHHHKNHLWCSPQYYEMLGYDPQDFITKGKLTVEETWINLIHPDDREKAAGAFAHYLETGSTEMYENSFRMACADGSWAWILSRGQTLKNPDGTPSDLTVGTHINITERKQMEEELRLQNGMITSLHNSIPDLVFYKDLDSVFLGCNQAFADMEGMTPEEIVGKTDYEIYSWEEAEKYISQDKQMLTQQSPSYTEEWITYHDGRKAIVETQKAPLMDSNNNVRGILGIARDITDRKKAEEKLQEFASQLENKNIELDIALYQEEAANEAKTKFLATMNHEIRTPLNGMLGFLQLLEETPVSDVQSKYMNYMNYSAHHLLSLVNNVLDMAKIEAGDMKLDKRSFHLAEEIDTALASLYPLAREKGLQLQVLKDPNLPDRLEGDPLRLRQILLNLVGNALKFTEEGSVCVTIESLGSTGGFHNLHLEVRDTGPGMDQDSQDMLFQPFFQIRDNHAAHPGGTGLGLPITRELVELMDGKIQVHSQPGAGSTFTVRLSLKEIKEAPQSHEKNSPSQKTNPVPEIPRLLLVEDQEMNQVLMKHRLTERGLAYDLAKNGKEAVKMTSRHPYDLILMDIQMPLMDGLEATRQIRNNTEIPQPRIVAMTACATLKDQEAFQAAGMDGFLTKPITTENLDIVLKFQKSYD